MVALQHMNQAASPAARHPAAAGPADALAERMAPASPFKALVREIIVRLPSSTSSQLDLIRELEVAVIGRRTELESCVVPVVVAERPAVGEIHPRDDPPPAPLPLLHPVHVPRELILRPPHGTVTHIAGEAYDEAYAHDDEACRDGPALTARFRELQGVVVTGGVLYISDVGANRIRKLHDGVVGTFAATGEHGFQDGDSDIAQFHNCYSIALDSSQGRLLVADSSNRRVRAVAMDGATTTLAGTGVHRHEDGPVASAAFQCVRGVAAAPDGSIFVSGDHSIRKISTDGIVTTIAGSGECGFEDGLGDEGRFDQPWGMALTASGTLVICDYGNNRLRQVDLSDGRVTTIGHPFELPTGVAHGSDGTLYVASVDGVHEIRSADGVASLLAFGPGDDDDPTSCHLDEPNGLLYVTTCIQIFTVSVHTAGERRAARVFPLVSLWALAHRDRASIAPSTGIVGFDEGEVRAVLSRLMRIRVVGVFGLVLRFAYA